MRVRRTACSVQSVGFRVIPFRFVEFSVRISGCRVWDSGCSNLGVGIKVEELAVGWVGMRI